LPIYLVPADGLRWTKGGRGG